MGQTDASRVQIQEGAYTFTNTVLSKAMLEIDRFINHGNTWVTITRTANYISKCEYFSDALKTKKIYERNYSRTGNRITVMTSIYFNANGSEDGRVTQTIGRNGATTQIETSSNPYSTTEPTAI